MGGFYYWKLLDLSVILESEGKILKMYNPRPCLRPDLGQLDNLGYRQKNIKVQP